MTTYIKNWKQFQHFKDRRPPWIKLYRELLDDINWHSLDGESAKILTMLWLVASDNQDGSLPDNQQLAFRLRITEKQLNQYFTKLSHWLIQDDITMISTRYQLDAPETETETETETERETDSFAQFWKIYPKKVGKDLALASWKKKKPRLDDVMFALSWQTQSKDWTKEDGKYIPMPATYLNQGRWKDEEPVEGVPF
jgi:hypothetical protein